MANEEDNTDKMKTTQFNESVVKNIKIEIDIQPMDLSIPQEPDSTNQDYNDPDSNNSDSNNPDSNNLDLNNPGSNNPGSNNPDSQAQEHCKPVEQQFVVIKQEYFEDEITVKVEPENSYDESFNNSLHIKIEHENGYNKEEAMTTDNQFSNAELLNNLHVKMENGSEEDSYSEGEYKDDGRKRSEKSDEEYVPPKKYKKKKKKPPANVKPSFGRPRKNKEEVENDPMYSEEVTKHIEIVTINEEERQIEHRELLNSRRHMRFLCEPCAVGYVLKEAHLLHMKVHAKESGDHFCDICNSYLKTRDVLYRHKLRHYRRYRCSICQIRMRDKDTAAAHVMTEHVGTAFLCTHCGRGFKRPQYLKRHVQQIHTKPLRLECPICKRVFHERGWYRCHVRNHNEEIRNGTAYSPVICSHCGKQCKNKSYLKRHLLTHEQHQATLCPICNKMFKNTEVLRTHCRRVHNQDNLPRQLRHAAACPKCQRVCSNRAMLAKHIQRMHEDRTKKFICSHCERAYRTKGEVRSHIMWSHMRRAGGHACACGRVFRSPARLRHHARAHHLRLPQPRDKLCKLCGKAFANQQVLNRHVKGHSGEKYPCTECGQTFKTQSYVKVHYKIKHLNMTRAEVKAQSRRKLLMVESMDEPEYTNVVKNKNGQDPLGFTVADVQIKIEKEDEPEPMFETFVQ